MRNKLNVESVSSFCDVVNYHENQDRLVVEIKNLKFRYSELSRILNDTHDENPES